MMPVLIEGRGIPVCDDYLSRLRLVEYENPPYRGRPESNEIEGFEFLNRTPLTIDEAVAFGSKVRNFSSSNT